MDTDHELITTETSDLNHIGTDQGLGEWLVDTLREWREHYQANFDTEHQKFYRAWRGI